MRRTRTNELTTTKTRNLKHTHHTKIHTKLYKLLWRPRALTPARPQISYADTDPIYTIENYPNFFRVVPSENALSLARIPFIRHFNWTRVGTIYQNLPRYSLVSARARAK